MLVTSVETLYITLSNFWSFFVFVFLFFWGGGVGLRVTPLYSLYGDVPLDRVWLFISLPKQVI